MNLPQTNDEKLKLALDILITDNKKKPNNLRSFSCVLNNNVWSDGKFELYQGSGTGHLLLYNYELGSSIYLPPDKKSPYFAPFVLALKVLAPNVFEEWIDAAALPQWKHVLTQGWRP